MYQQIQGGEQVDYQPGDNQNTIYTNPENGGYRIRFKIGTAEFYNSEEKDKLLKILEMDIPEGSVIYIDGYASSDGDSKKNMELSDWRAYKVKRLISEKFPNLEIHMNANGEVPLNKNDARSAVVNIVYKEYKYIWPDNVTYLDQFNGQIPNQWNPPQLKSNNGNSTKEYRDNIKEIADKCPIRNWHDGYGKLQVQTFTLSAHVGKQTFDAVKSQYARDPSVFNNNWLGTYYPLGDNYDKNKDLKVGDKMYIDIAGPLNGFVEFTHIITEDNYFEIEARTLNSTFCGDIWYNHPDAGTIYFSGKYDSKLNLATIKIENHTTAGNELTHYSGFSDWYLNVPRGAQKLQWRNVIRNIEDFMLGPGNSGIKKQKITIFNGDKAQLSEF